MKTTFKAPLFNPKVLLAVAADVSKEKSNYACELGEAFHEIEAGNARGEILDTLASFRSLAKGGGYRDSVLIVEPTGGYERPLVRAARHLGMGVFYANTEAVKRLQVVQDGTSSKSDRKDPRTILTVAKVGRLMKCRDLPGRWQALRQMNVHHDRLEVDLARLKCRVRKLVDELFPRLDFSSQWYFGKAALKFARLYRFDPYAMRRDGFAAAAKKLRKAKLTAGTVARLVDQGMVAVEVELDPFYVGSLGVELAEVYESVERAMGLKASLEDRFESIYDELLESGEARVQPVALVMPKVRLAMLHGETGPLDDFEAIGQLRKYAGMNLRLNESGKSFGKRRLSKKGRSLIRKLLTQTCLPLVRRGELFGEEYHARKAAGCPGTKALTAIANKYLGMLFGVHRSERAYDAGRVFANESDFGRKAA